MKKIYSPNSLVQNALIPKHHEYRWNNENYSIKQTNWIEEPRKLQPATRRGKETRRMNQTTVGAQTSVNSISIPNTPNAFGLLHKKIAAVSWLLLCRSRRDIRDECGEET